MIRAPGAPDDRLYSPGSCLVVVAEEAGRIELTVRASQNGGSLDARVRLEVLDNGAPDDDALSEPISEQSGGQGRADLRMEFELRAHISRRGDVTVSGGGWAGGPQAPAVIEGIEFSGRAPIEAQALTAGRNAKWTQWSPPGAFLGTRGRGLPLVGVRLRLAPSLSRNVELAAEAMFLGSPIVGKRGRDIEFVGPFGSDPLVGLRINLVEAVEAARVARTDTISVPEPSSLRIFRPRGVGRAV